MRKIEVERFMRRESAKGLSRPARAVYRVLLVCAKADSGTLRFERIGDKRFRDETGYGRTSVKAARKELLEVGLLEVLAVGDGRERSAYRVVLEATELERQLVDEQIAEYAVAVGAEGFVPPPPSDPVGVNPRPPGGQNMTPPTRAHPSLSGSDRPYPSGQGPWTSEEAALRATEELSPGFAGAARCPTAASRGKPCASCRACGTNPRALRQAAAAARRTSTVADLFSGAPPPSQRVATNQRGLALARAAVPAKPKSGHDQGRAAPAVSRPPGGTSAERAPGASKRPVERSPGVAGPPGDHQGGGAPPGEATTVVAP